VPAARRSGWLPGPPLYVLNHYGIRLIPWALAEKIIPPIATTIYRLQGGKLDQAKQNYALITGRTIDDPEVAQLARSSLAQFGRYIAEMVHVQAWSNDTVLDRLEVGGEDNFARAEAYGKGIIFVSAHMGSAEVAASLALLRGYTVTAVTEQLRPKVIMDWAIACRAALGVKLVPVSRAGVTLLRALRRKQTVAMVVDAGIDKGGGVPVRFLGRETVFPVGPARLARLSGAPIVFAVAVRLPGGRFRATVCEPVVSDHEADAADDILRMTQDIAEKFEPFVRQNPDQWYVFRDIWPHQGASAIVSA
jgi:KDO2-lipid IV(A) lauroyltransferase